MLSLLLAVSLLAAPGDVPDAKNVAPEVVPLDPVRMKAESEEATVAMRTSLKKLLAMVEKSRQARDIVLLNCLNEKLTAMKALIRVGEQSNINLQEFIAKDQIEGATHERRKVSLASDKVKSLFTEAESCLGESGAGAPRTVVTVEKPDHPGDPTHLDQQDPREDDLETAPSASPYN